MVVKAAEDRLQRDCADAPNRAMKRGVLVHRSSMRFPVAMALIDARRGSGRTFHPIPGLHPEPSLNP
jgi:hypothetical protein